MAPICARNAAARSCCCAAWRVAARANPGGNSPSTTAPAPIAAIICNHSRRVLLVTLLLTVHLSLEVRCNMSRGEARARPEPAQSPALDRCVPRSHHAVSQCLWGLVAMPIRTQPAMLLAQLPQPSPAYKRRVWLAVTGLALFLALYFLLAAWFLFTAYRLTVAADSPAFSGILVGICALFLAVFMLKPVFFVKHGSVDDAVEIT